MAKTRRSKGSNAVQRASTAADGIYASPLPKEIRVNPIRSQAGWQAMWKNRLPEYSGGASKAVVNHALPKPGLKSRNDLFAAWVEAADTGS